jgi:hypothetical protein
MISCRIEVRNKERYFTLTLPDYCPFCQKHSALQLLNAYVVLGDDPYNDIFKLALRCHNSNCQEVMIGVYAVDFNVGEYLEFIRIEGGRPKIKHFSSCINEVSSDFGKIYNQAEIAEQSGLAEICGVGYRRALEFLIKDYAIKLNGDKAEMVKKLLLGECIERFIENDKIKGIAKRAAWLGNDETHYVRKWVDKTLTDLKTLIDITIHFIEMEELYKASIDSMPDPKKKDQK